MFRANFLEFFFAFNAKLYNWSLLCAHTERLSHAPKNNGHNTKKTADFLCHQICSYYFCDNNLYYIVIN